MGEGGLWMKHDQGLIDHVFRRLGRLLGLVFIFSLLEVFQYCLNVNRGNVKTLSPMLCSCRRFHLCIFRFCEGFEVLSDV
jgi:hypothetical protein